MYRNDHKTTLAIWLLALGATLTSPQGRPALAQDEETAATETAAAPEVPARDATLTGLGLELEAAGAVVGGAGTWSWLGRRRAAREAVAAGCGPGC